MILFSEGGNLLFGNSTYKHFHTKIGIFTWKSEESFFFCCFWKMSFLSFSKNSFQKRQEPHQLPHTQIFKWCFWRIAFKSMFTHILSMRSQGKKKKKVFEFELQLNIIWLKLSSTPPVIINAGREAEKYLQPSYIIANKVHLLFTVPSYNNSSYIYDGFRILPVVDECETAFIKNVFLWRCSTFLTDFMPNF